MSSREAFGVLVRALGVWSIVEGLHHFVVFVNIFFHFYDPLHDTATSFLLLSVVELIAGFYLLRGAPHLVDYAYTAVSELDSKTDV
jgi:hypothetical protein